MLPSNASDWETTQQSGKTGGPRRAGGLVVMVGLLIVLIAVIAVAVTRLPTGSLSRPAASSAAAPRIVATAAPAAPGVAADAATQQTIQQVIQKLDEAQAQAIATKDPNVMAATAMPAFYAEEVQSNQDLEAAGVTEIKLLKLEWGDITTDGTTVTATVYETWSTTFSDGSTEQSRDRNVYTLVQDNCAWKVQSDVHPDAPTSP